MTLVVSPKGSSLAGWRAAENFTASFRQDLLNRTATLLPDQTLELLRNVELQLEEQALAHEAVLARVRHLADMAATAGGPSALKSVAEEFYAAVYRFFGWNRSATAFYALSAQFQKGAVKSVAGYAKKRLERMSCRLPPVALIGVGQSGRSEYSPFCRMQLLLVHGEAEPQQKESLGAFGRILHEGLEAAGLLMDEVATPRNAEWRASQLQLPQWLAGAVQNGAMLLPLADQSVLYDEEGIGERFRADCLEILFKSRPARNNLAERLDGFTNGIGIMGGFKLERKGLQRGKFRLSANALLPLAAAFSALALIKEIGVCGTPARIRELLGRGGLNVEMAERLLKTWHLFHELRLATEAAKQPDWESDDISYLELAALGDAGQDEFRRCLETTAGALRHAAISYNDREE